MRGRFFEDYKVGEVIRSGGITLTESAIIDFAWQYDPQPFHLDTLAAAETMYGGLIASGWQVLLLGFRLMVQEGMPGQNSLGSPGVDEVRFHLPTRPGDTISGAAEIMEVRASATRPDRGLLRVKFRMENQKGETVVSFFGTQFVRRRQPG
jgi:acyl dehydratase